MKNLLLVLFTIFLAYNASAQKFYVGCPDQIGNKPNVGFLDKQAVDLIITDSRVIPSYAKVECDGSGVKQTVKKFLQLEFPSCKITLLPDTNISKSDKVTIKIGIASYQASSSKSEWTGVVSYHVMIMDNRTGKAKKVTEEISNDTSKPGILGYKTAKKCLFTSFDKSNQDLASFIEASLK